MCGIAGMFGHGDREQLEAMLARIDHRGPDDRHLVVGRDFALGATRLSIVDLAGGRQPVSDESGTIWAAQNGEIYNFPELRPQLVARGHQLASHCDTEVLPHLYQDHGPAFVRQLDGMFAVCVWDDRRKVGVLARDRMGKKPLYYRRQGDCLYFASEIKSLLALPGAARELDLEALSHFLSYKHVPHPLTIFRDIAILPPAHSLVFRPGHPPTIERYWDIAFDGSESSDNEEELVDRLLDLLRQGVKRRLMADVPIGFFLSGGLDSALSTAVAAEMSPGRIKTFTLVYDDESTTPGKEADRRWARWTADRYQTEHHEETIAYGDFPEQFRRILTAFDEPFGGVVSTYFLAQAIAKHVKVALAGDGADELFGSYLSHRLAQPVANYDEYRRTGDVQLIRPFENRPEFVQRFAGQPGTSWRTKLFVFSDEEKLELWHPDLRPIARSSSTAAHWNRLASRLRGRDPLNHVLEAEFRTFFPDQVLTFVDRLSMAHSLEVRSAFLDTRFVEFAARLPQGMKINGGETKYLLKKAASRYFPHDMVYRPKEGFVMPINGWLLGKLSGYVRDTLSPASLATHGLFDSHYVARLMAEFYAGRSEHANKLLSLIAFQEWFTLYRPTIGGRIPCGSQSMAASIVPGVTSTC